MRCRHCGAEIAEKALICYRCGTATTEARFQAPGSNAGGPWPLARIAIIAIVLVLLLVLLAFFLLHSASTSTTGRERVPAATVAADSGHHTPYVQLANR